MAPSVTTDHCLDPPWDVSNLAMSLKLETHLMNAHKHSTVILSVMCDIVGTALANEYYNSV